MNFTLYHWPLFISAIILMNVALFLRRYHDERAIRWFISLIWLGVVLITLQAAELAADSRDLKILFLNLRIPILALISSVVLIFSLEYTGKSMWITPRLLMLLAFGFIIFTALALTSKNHSLYRTEYLVSPTGLLTWERQPAFWLNIFYTYAIYLIAFAVLLTSFGIRKIYFWDTILVVSGLAVPLLADLVFNLGIWPIQGFNPMPSSLSITGLLYLWALARMRLFAIAPIARNTIIDSIDDLVFALDTHGNIVDFNQAAQNACLPLPQSFGKSPETLPSPWAIIFRSHEKSVHHQDEVQVESDTYALAISPIVNRRKHIIGKLFIFHNITEQKLNEAKNRQLSRAVEQSPVSIIITDLAGKIEYVNPRFEQTTGYKQQEVLGKNPRILKTDRTHTETYKQLWELLRTGHEWHGEFVNRKKNGDIYYESATIAPIVDAKGTITHYISSSQDITSQKLVEDALIRREREMATLYEMSLEMNSFTDLPTLLRATVRRACELLKMWGGLLFMYRPDEDLLDLVIGYEIPYQWIGIQVHANEGMAGRILLTKKPLVVQDYLSWEHRLMLLNDNPARRTLGVPLKVRGEVIGVIILMDQVVGDFDPNEIRLATLFADQAAIAVENARLVNDLRQANDQLNTQLGQIRGLQAILREQAIRDPLTNLHNRRFLNEMLPHEIARAQREEYEVGFVMIDIDHFKQVNDTYGHDAGDIVLQNLSGLLIELARASDIVCRYGGEEFLAVLSNTNVAEAYQIAERWRIAFENIITPFDGHSIRATISCGVALFPQDGDTGKEAITSADKALYHAKNSGRNRVSIAIASETPTTGEK